MAMITLLASPLIQVVIEKVADGLSGELRLLRGVHGDMERLQSILSTIKDVLDDAENKAIGEKALCSWLKKLKDATYDADDVVDTFCTEALRQQIEYHDHFKRHLVRDVFSSQNPIIFSRRIARKLKHVLGRLDDIAAERHKFHLTPGSVSVRHVQPVETNSAVHELEILGRKEDKEKIVHFLINEETDKDLSVLAVVGLGGIGKTALAKLVYNDDRVTAGQFFDLRIWICVSDVFDVKEIARKLMECVKEKPYHNLELETLSNLVRDTLSGKRFFLVLDDVWNEEPAKWESLQTLLRFGRSGSKIVTTTRNEVVANVMGSVSRCRLKVLSVDDCWTLFSQRAFQSVEETANLTKIGKEIVEKCGGLPLAAKALGSLMSLKKEEFEWLAIRDSEIWQNANEILPALNLSYYHLPSHLKNCFVYCSLFPKDYEFGKKELIRLWISEGFIPPSMNENISPHDAGNQCFDSLLSRSFFQDVKKHSYSSNEEITCKMHDLVHDLACSVAKDEFYFTKYQKETKINDSCRYLSLLVDDKSPNILDILFKTKKLRSLILIRSYYRIEVNPDVFVRLRNLRVLNLSRRDISVFPSTICRLKHLRFLDISHAGMKVLPSNIDCLYNLQTLILSCCRELTNLPNTITNLHNLHTLDVAFCYQLVELPRDIRKMKNLRHLDNRECSKLSGMPMGMGQLTNLETLPEFIVGEEEGQHITELQQLNRIRGYLCIKNLQKVTNPIEARDANLGAKIRVKSLYLEWGDERRDAAADVAVEEEVIASLVPPPNLESLELRNYLGINYPSNWMIMSSYNSLERFKLVGLRRCAYLPPLAQLPSLKILKISRMDAIRRIGEELYGEARGDKVPFCLLERLYLYSMKNLEEWVVEAAAGAGPGDIRRRRDVVMFPCLTKLEIVDCPKLKRVHPSFPVSVVDLSISIKGEVVLAAGSLSGMNRVRNLYLKVSSTSSSSFWEGLPYLTALEKLIFEGSEGDSKATCLPEGLIHLRIPTLRNLVIYSFYGEVLTTCLAAGLQQQPQPPPLLFTSLHILHIEYCQSLTVLPEWVGNLTSLQRLELSYCYKLEMLPDGLQHLTALQQLTIDNCPIVEKRCEREIGEDWHKIKHIPHIQIIPFP